jgi:hypothetical protein
LALLTEVQSLRPFLEAGKKAAELWKQVANVISLKFNGSVDVLSVKRRFKLILADFESADSKHRYEYVIYFSKTCFNAAVYYSNTLNI